MSEIVLGSAQSLDWSMAQIDLFQNRETSRQAQSLLVDSKANKRQGNDRERDVAGKEVRDGELVEERAEAIKDEDDGKHDYAEPCHVRLKP
jgi:hypothetical protein